MGRWLSALIVVSLAASALAEPAIDYAREERWAQEIVPALVVGDAVWLATPARPRVLAILTEPSHASKGGVIIVHGLGVNPDFGLINGVRTGLADAGYTTLAVQMPVLAATARATTTPSRCPRRVTGSPRRLPSCTARAVTKIAIVSHSLGATMANAYLARSNAPLVDAWVPVGMQVDFAAPPKEPVLDVTAENELAAVVRRRLTERRGCRRIDARDN